MSQEAAAFVDAQVAPFAHRIGLAALERLIAEAIARFMPDKAAEDAEKSADSRHFTIDHQQVSFGGTSQLTGELDLADALDLDAAVAKGAQQLLALGSTDSLDVRRSIAAGQIARNQLALDLDDRKDEAASAPPAADRSRVRWCCTCTSPTPRSPGPKRVAGAGAGREQAPDPHRRPDPHLVRQPDTEVIVKPVIDLNEHIHVEGYEVPDRLREQVTLRDHTCVFPWCTRSARKMDADHVIPYAEGGTTSSDNIAPLCRRHHRLKTHSAWTYTMLEPGSFLWSSPHGYQFLRDHHGTLDVSRDPARLRCNSPCLVSSDRSLRSLLDTSLVSSVRSLARCSTTGGRARPSL